VDDRQNMRVSDADRQETVDRLRIALDEGRLKMDEYLQRMERAYEAVTYSDLNGLCDDLPVPRREHVAPAPVRSAAPARVPEAAVPAGFYGRMPAALKVFWTIWAVAVSVNIVIWVLVMGTSGHLVYPWPVWVAGPYGAALLAITAAVMSGRRGHGRGRPPLPPGSRP
jgi:hypothetical protein